MVAMLSFLTLIAATLLAAGMAVALDWLLLRAAFHLMRPAAARNVSLRTGLVAGTVQLARAFSPHR
jgi:hypothetical protein